MERSKKALSLVNFADSYRVSVRGKLIQQELEWLFMKTGVRPSDALFISYAYKGPDYPAYFREVSDIFMKSGIKLTDIVTGDPESLIAASKMIVAGGGDIATFITRMNALITPAFNPYLAVKNRVDLGIPYIGWNEGSNIISPKYFTPPLHAIPEGINVSPFQIVCNFPAGMPGIRETIRNFLLDNPVIAKVICQAEIYKPDGSSVRLEESGGGMIDTATDPYPVVIRFRIVNGNLEES